MNACRLIVSMCLLILAACAHEPQPVDAKADGFWFIFLETGKKTPDDKALVGQMQRGHIDNFKRLFAEQKLFAAGPLQDPSTLKRGIVIVKAPTREILTSYFQPDEYVREGYMTHNAVRAVAHKALATEGIDASGVEEVRIVQVLRDTPAAGSDVAANRAFLQALVEKRSAGGWYTMESDPSPKYFLAAPPSAKCCGTPSQIILRRNPARPPSSSGSNG